LIQPVLTLTAEPTPSDPSHPFTSLLKRKLASLHPEALPSQEHLKRTRSNTSTGGLIRNISEAKAERELGPEDRELLEGLRRFKGSAMGKEVRDVCVNQ